LTVPIGRGIHGGRKVNDQLLEFAPDLAQKSGQMIDKLMCLDMRFRSPPKLNDNTGVIQIPKVYVI